MKTLEELKEMTHEDLARLAYDLQSGNKELEKNVYTWMKMYTDTNERFKRFKDAVKSVAILCD